MLTLEGESRDRIRIVICDESDRRRSGTRFWLSEQSDFLVVADVAHPTDLLSQAAGPLPDVVLMDSETGDCELLDVVHSIQERSATTEVVVLATDLPPRRLAAMEDAGAVGVLSESLGAEEMAAAVRKAAAGEVLFTREQRLAIKAWRKTIGDRLPTLTEREWDIWAAVLEGKRNRDIANRFGLSNNTIKNQLSHVFEKLGVNSRTELFRLTIDNGLEEVVARHAAGHGEHNAPARKVRAPIPLAEPA